MQASCSTHVWKPDWVKPKNRGYDGGDQKAKVIVELIDQYGAGYVEFYDDSSKNIEGVRYWVCDGGRAAGWTRIGVGIGRDAG